MSLYDLNHLYQAMIMERSRKPKHKGTLEHPTYRKELLNPTCGDAIVVELQCDDPTITAVRFNGEGCAISMASADMMAQTLQGKTKEEALQLIAFFDHLVGGVRTQVDQEHWNKDTLKKQLGDAYLLQGVKKFPARYKCAILAWRAVSLVLEEEITI